MRRAPCRRDHQKIRDAHALQLTDASLTLADHQIAAQWRGVRERVAEVQASRLRRLHRLLGDLATLAEDEDLDAADLRSRLHDLIAPFEAERRSTRVAESRRELGHRSQELARLLKTVRGAKLAVPTEHAVAAAFVTLDSLTASGSTLLPPATPQPFGPSWQGLIDQPDRVAALGCYRAATAMALKRGLRNGSITVAHSFSHRAAEDNLIAASLWQRSRARFIRALNLPAGPEPYLQRLEAGLTASLAILAKAAEAGAVAVEDGELRLPRRKPAPRDPRVDPARQALTLAVGNAQLPEVIIEGRPFDPFLLGLARPCGPIRVGIGNGLCQSHRPRLRPFRCRTGAHGAGVGSGRSQSDGPQDRSGRPASRRQRSTWA